MPNVRQSKCWNNFVNIWRVPSTATTRSYDLIRSNCAELVGQLFLTHQRLVADWIPFDRYLNNHVDLDALLGGGYGKLADGPEFLVAAYAAILERHGVSPSLLPARPAKWYDGRAWVETETHLNTLILGGSFFVAVEYSEQPAQ
jgi:hypothetical protein